MRKFNNKNIFQHLLRHVLENQHKLHKFLQLLQQQQTRHCSSGRLQQAIQPEIEQDYPQVKTIDPSSSYYPADQPFKHEPDVGDQFAVSKLSIKKFKCLILNCWKCITTLITIGKVEKKRQWIKNSYIAMTPSHMLINRHFFSTKLHFHFPMRNLTSTNKFKIE